MIRMAVGLLVFLVLLFGPAGRLDLPIRWAFVGTLVIMVIIVRRVIDPGLAKERIKPAPGGEDRYMRFMVFPFFVGHIVLTGLDVGRFHWSDTVPTLWRMLALVVLACSLGFTVWAIYVNRFFSPVVRIQQERSHTIITVGPYRWMRHPGYASALVSMVASPLVLGSWWSMALLIVPFGLILRRVFIEDRFLHENLEGYHDYASKVRYRILPRVW